MTMKASDGLADQEPISSVAQDDVDVQPPEIEAVLAQHKQVKETAVLIREDQPEKKRFVVFVVPQKAQPGLVRTLRSYLSDQLPPLPLPLLFVFLDALPLTPDGTIDQHALANWDLSRSQLSTAYDEPQTETERQVAKLLSQVLEISPVGRNDDFFEMGGHSLLAVRFTVQVIETFGVRIPPRRFYKATTVAELAQVIEELLEEQQGHEGDE